MSASGPIEMGSTFGTLVVGVILCDCSIIVSVDVEPTAYGFCFNFIPVSFFSIVGVLLVSTLCVATVV